MLFVRQLDVPNPHAYRGNGQTDATRDLLYRKPFIAAKLTCTLAFLCFHLGQQSTHYIGREAGEGNRTPISRVETSRSTIELRPREGT